LKGIDFHFPFCLAFGSSRFFSGYSAPSCMAPNIGTGVWRAPHPLFPLRHLAMLHSIRPAQCRSGLGADHLPPPISMRCLGWTRRLARTHLCCGALTGAAGVIVQHLLRERGGAIAFVGSAAPTCFGADAGRSAVIDDLAKPQTCRRQLDGVAAVVRSPRRG
jgi:hypothetical protein